MNAQKYATNNEFALIQNFNATHNGQTIDYSPRKHVFVHRNRAGQLLGSAECLWELLDSIESSAQRQATQVERVA